MTSPVPVWIAQLWKVPVAMALAVPLVPLTESGGDVWPMMFHPQQTTSPVPVWIAQLWKPPAAMALAVPLVPSTEGGGDAWL